MLVVVHVYLPQINNESAIADLSNFVGYYCPIAFRCSEFPEIPVKPSQIACFTRFCSGIIG